MDIVLILANGVWADDADARRRSFEAGFVIAVDGGYAKALSSGARVDLVVGDLDSLSRASEQALLASPVAVRRYPAAKDWSDLELALDEALARRPEKIVVLGALGGRLDQTLTNVHLLERGLRERIPIELADRLRSVVLIDGRHDVTGAAIGDSVSLVPISESARVTTNGLLYALRDEVLQRAASRGVSNVVTELPVIVDALDGTLLVIHERAEVAS